MRIYQPKNELGQPLLNEGQLVATSKSITKNLVDGSITLTDADVSGISNWDVKNVEMIIDGHTVAFTAGIEKNDTGIIIHFADANEASKLDFTSAKLTLQLVDSQGFALGEGNEPTLTLEVKLTNAISSGELANIDAVVDEIIATGDKERIQAAGATLAEYAKNSDNSDIQYKYGYAGYKSAEDFSNNNEFVDDEGYFDVGDSFLLSLESVEGYYRIRVRWSETFTNDLPCLRNGYYMFESNTHLETFSAKMPNLETGDSMFVGCYNLTSFSSDLSSLTDGNCMFNGCSDLTSFATDLSSLTDGRGMFNSCSSLTSFSSDLSSLTDGSEMFYYCSNLTSFTSDLSSLTDGSSMFAECQLDQASVDHILATIKGYSAGDSHYLTLGVAEGVDKKEAEFAAKGWIID